MAISYQVSKILLDYYRKAGDSLHYARALYRCTTQELALCTFHMETRYPGSPYLGECLALAERFGELPEEALGLALQALSMSCFRQQGFDYPLCWRVDDVLCAAMGDALIEEFRAGAGTHYGAQAVAALSVPEVRDRLQYLITEGRKEVYYKIYTSQKL